MNNISDEKIRNEWKEAYRKSEGEKTMNNYKPSCFDCMYAFIVEDMSVGIQPGLDDCTNPDEFVIKNFHEAIYELEKAQKGTVQDDLEYIENLGFGSHEEFYANRCQGFTLSEDK